MNDPRDPVLHRYATTVLGCLADMDAAATPTASGQRTGLWWYGGHAEPHLARPRTEPCWSSHLAERLTAAAYPSRSEVCYPASSRQLCDVVSVLPDGGELWLEIKGAWKEWWRERGNDRAYHSYLVDDPRLPRSHTAQKDIAKLATLRGSVHVGFLLVGFDSVGHPMDGDVDELVATTSLHGDAWRRWHRCWSDRQAEDERVQAWLWIAPSGTT